MNREEAVELDRGEASSAGWAIGENDGGRWVDREGSRGGFGEWVAAADPRKGKAVGGGG